jgi:glycosyltransferase involved in cell wall biosynthesis
MLNKKKLLIVLPNIPYPLDSGGNIGVFEMVNYLRNVINITLIVPNSDKLSLNELQTLWTNVRFCEYERNEGFEQKVYRKLLKKCLGYFLYFNDRLMRNKIKYSDTKTYRDSLFTPHVYPDLVEKVNDLIKAEQFDFLQIEFYKLLPLICFLPRNLKIIFVLHEIRFLRLEQEFEREVHNRNQNNFYISQIRGLEMDLLKQYDKIILLSDFDRKILLKEIEGDKLITSPLTIRKNDLKSNDDYKFDNKLFFIGGSGHMPNVDAVTWFLENCWEKIIAQKSNLRFIIIGQWVESKVQEFSKYKNVEFLGFVDSLSDNFKNGILVVPIRIGSGIRMKIIDSVNHGIPFVSTSVGVEGLNFRDDFDCMIADSPDLLVDKILMLIDDVKLQTQLIKNSKNTLNSEYSYERITTIRERIYD